MATFTVDTTNDVVDAGDGVLSLREAVTAAQTGDTINFNVALSGSTINLALGTISISEGITIDGDIDGNSTPDIILSGDPDGAAGFGAHNRHFVITTDLGEVVTLNGLTLEDGESNGGGGSTYHSGNGTLVIEDSEFVDNFAAGSNGEGGALYSTGGALTITNTVFDDNAASTNGGALAIVNTTGPVIIDSSEIDFSYANKLGGGVYALNAADLTIRNNSWIMNNRQGHSDGMGGGIYIEGGVTTFDSSTINGNEARGADGELGGGGLAIVNGTIAFVDTYIDENATDGYGGGILAINSTVATAASGLDVSYNVAAQYGGGIAILGGTFLAETPNVTDNIVGTTSYTKREGGVRFLTAAPGTGGGIYATDEADVELESASITGNDATLNGGAIGLEDGVSLVLYSPDLSSNTDASGGSIFTESGTSTEGGLAMLAPVLGAIRVTGTNADDYFEGDASANTLSGRAGDDMFDPLLGNDLLTLGAGADRVFGTPLDLDGDTISDFTSEDMIIIVDGAEDGFAVTPTGDAIKTTVGIVDTFSAGGLALSLTGDFTSGLFSTAIHNGDIMLGYLDEIQTLAEGVTVADKSAPEAYGAMTYLASASDFDISVDFLTSFTRNNNSLGVYEFNIDTGDIEDVVFFAADALTKTPDITLSRGADTILLPFLVMDGFDFFDGRSSDTLTFDSNGTLLVNGADVGLTTFHLNNEMNEDELTHVTLGVSGDTLVFGFEDTLGQGDADFQDLVVHFEID